VVFVSGMTVMTCCTVLVTTWVSHDTIVLVCVGMATSELAIRVTTS